MNRQQYHKEWYLKNRERRFISAKKWREAHKDHVRSYGKKWRQKNREKMREYYKKYRSTEKYKRARKLYYEKNREKLRLYHQKNNQSIRLKCLFHYGGNPPKCACCEEKEIAFLALDHIKNDGNKHRKIIRKSIFYWAIKNNFPKGLQVLCHNCNMAKAFYNICPHNKDGSSDSAK